MITITLTEEQLSALEYAAEHGINEKHYDLHEAGYCDYTEEEITEVDAIMAQAEEALAVLRKARHKTEEMHKCVNEEESELATKCRYCGTEIKDYSGVCDRCYGSEERNL